MFPLVDVVETGSCAIVSSTSPSRARKECLKLREDFPYYRGIACGAAAECQIRSLVVSGTKGKTVHNSGICLHRLVLANGILHSRSQDGIM
jgi:hypothetical protein